MTLLKLCVVQNHACINHLARDRLVCCAAKYRHRKLRQLNKLLVNHRKIGEARWDEMWRWPLVLCVCVVKSVWAQRNLRGNWTLSISCSRWAFNCMIIVLPANQFAVSLDTIGSRYCITCNCMEVNRIMRNRSLTNCGSNKRNVWLIGPNGGYIKREMIRLTLDIPNEIHSFSSYLLCRWCNILLIFELFFAVPKPQSDTNTNNYVADSSLSSGSCGRLIVIYLSFFSFSPFPVSCSESSVWRVCDVCACVVRFGLFANGEWMLFFRSVSYALNRGKHEFVWLDLRCHWDKSTLFCSVIRCVDVLAAYVYLREFHELIIWSRMTTTHTQYCKQLDRRGER